MNLEILSMAFASINANKVRASLSMLGIIIGVSTVIVVVSISLGAKQTIDNQFKNLSVNSIMIQATRGEGSTTASKLSEADVPKIISDVANIQTGMAVVNGNTQVSVAGKDSKQYSLVGGYTNYFDLSNLVLLNGRIFTDEEITSKAKVAVIGNTVVTDLFDGDANSALGQYLTVSKRKVEIIGVLQIVGSSMRGANNDESIFIPYTTAKKTFLGERAQVRLTILANDVKNIPMAIEDITALLRTNHKIKEDGADDFRIFDAGSLVSTAKDTSNILSILLISIATIVLIVSGIGIMNVMFVTVAERTKEIGIMKAVGAKQKDILIQFLLEAVILSVLGGAIGIILGEIVIPFLNLGGVLKALPSNTGRIIAFSFSVMVGIIFGFYPALKASQLDPVDALRSE